MFWIVARLRPRRELDSLLARCVQRVRNQMAFVKLLLLEAQFAPPDYGFKLCLHDSGPLACIAGRSNSDVSKFRYEAVVPARHASSF